MVLDIIFVVFFRWSVAGAAIATVLSQAAMTVYLVLYSTRKYDVLRFSFHKRAFDSAVFLQGCHFGLPPMLQSSVSSIGSLILQNFMNGFGTQTVAAVTTAYRVDSIIMVPIINLGSGISTLTARDYGAGRPRQAKKNLIAGTGIMIIVSLLLTAFVISAGGHLIAIFGAGQEAIAIGDSFFHRIAAFYLVYGLATAVRSYLEGIGDVVYSSFAGIVSLISRILFSYALASIFFNMVIAYAEAFSWVVLLILYVIRMVWKNWKMKNE